MKFKRIISHLFFPYIRYRNLSSAKNRERISNAIKEAEKGHSGELRFVIEMGLPFHMLIHDLSPRERALDLFSLYRVWDTAENSGILIYICAADRTVEVVCDRGINEKVDQGDWDDIRDMIIAHIKSNDFANGACKALEKASALLKANFPLKGYNKNELSDEVRVI